MPKAAHKKPQEEMMTEPQYGVWRLAAERTVEQIAKRLGKKEGVITQIVDRMVKRNWLSVDKKGRIVKRNEGGRPAEVYARWAKKPHR